MNPAAKKPAVTQAAKRTAKPVAKTPTKPPLKPPTKPAGKLAQKSKPKTASVPKSAAKPVAKTVVPKKVVATKPVETKVVTKKVVAKAKPVAAKVVTKKVVAKAKPVAAKVVTKKVVAKKVVAKKSVTRKAVAKRVVAKAKPVVKKVVATKLVARKPAAPKKVAPVKVAPVKVAPVKVAPVKVAPVKVASKSAQAPATVQANAKTSRTTFSAGFSALGIPNDVLAALAHQGIAEPFPIQSMTIPDGLAGRDVCGQAKTGSGKTLAFGIPLVARITEKALPGKPLALVLVPTRELAAQVEREMVWLAKPRGHAVVSIYGGVSMENQKALLSAGAEIVVATPGRLIDLLGRGDIDLGKIQFLVVDEADRMCDMGFMPNLEWLLRKMPKQRQTLLFSATLGSDVNSLIRHELRDPVRHVVESTTSTVDSSVHHFFQVHQMDRPKVIASILKANDRGIVFLNTKRACDRLADDLKDQGLVVRAIHGDLSQDQRNRALKQFVNGQIKALVATDVAARGLHIDGVDVVIQADIPDDHKTYLHRAGRTARAGATGVVVTLAMWNQLLDLERLQKRLGMKTKPVELYSNDPRLATLADWIP
jgi:superfamily II DNA/RNA helicase